MTDNLQKTAREKSIENGRQIVIAIIAYFVLLEVLTFIFTLLSGQAIKLVSIIRFVLTIITGIYLYKGQNWAKLLLSLGAILGFFIFVYTIFLQTTNPSISAFNFIFLLVLAIFQGMTAYLLIFSSEVDEFLRSRKM